MPAQNQSLCFVVGPDGTATAYAASGASSLSKRRPPSMATSCGWLRGVPQPSRRTSERADPWALLPLRMQTTFNLNTCIYVHPLNGMRPAARIVAFEEILWWRGIYRGTGQPHDITCFRCSIASISLNPGAEKQSGSHREDWTVEMSNRPSLNSTVVSLQSPRS